MNSLIVIVAQDALYVVALVAAVVWLLAPRPEKVALAVQVVVAAIAVGILVKLTSALYVDPRPFVGPHAVKPLFSHPNDNGFPSDHTSAATAVALVVAAHRRLVGVVLLVLALAIGSARVLAHVHHWLDIGVGALVGLIAAAVGLLVWQWVAPRLPGRLVGADRVEVPTA